MGHRWCCWATASATGRHGKRRSTRRAGLCRTAQSTGAPFHGAPVRLDTWGAWSKLGPLIALQEGQMPRDADGPVRL